MKRIFFEQMKAILIICAVFFSIFSVNAIANIRMITGAGATFPYPLFSQWAHAYQEIGQINLNYQSIGSGGGIRQIKANTVDFGASEMPLENTELNQNDLVQFPIIIGGVVLVVNLPGIMPGQLKLTSEILAEIYLGKIIYWDDPEIVAVNPSLSLSHQNISVIHRADSSGTTYLFTNYLAKQSNTWKTKVGNSVAVAWPVGLGGKGNEGVAAYVQRIPGSIGYVEFAYAKQNNMIYTLLKNKENQFVTPSVDSFRSASEFGGWASSNNFNLILTDQPGKNSWPITGATFILMHRVQTQPAQGKAILNFFNWAYKNGNDMALQLDYVSLPNNVVNLVEQYWQEKIKDNHNQNLWP